jgi:hypothetical protein
MKYTAQMGSGAIIVYSKLQRLVQTIKKLIDGGSQSHSIEIA